MASRLERLRQRKLVQWGAAYLAGAWLLLQVAGQLRDTFGWPAAIVRVLTLLLGVGFLAALVLAWYHGEKGEQRVTGIEVLMLAAILLLAGAALAWVRGSVGQAAPAATLGSPAGAETVGTGASPRSIAVLPFENLSESKDNEYFADGVTEEILTTLANAGHLMVISRTSVMQYKGSTKPIRQIAAELGVGAVLEGSVQRAEGRVRITAQLIDARTQAHLWAQTYDRDLKDLFAVQSDIAQAIASALNARLTEGEHARMDRRPTTNLRAHDDVLHARSLLQNPGPESIDAALGLIGEAIELDPSYADAYAGRSTAYFLRYYALGAPAGVDSAVVAARRAIELDSGFAPGYNALGWALTVRGERAPALAAFQRAVKLNPSLSDGLANLYADDFGQLAEAARWWARTLESDPTNALSLWLAGRTYLSLGLPERARASFLRAKQVQPDFYGADYHLSLTYLAEGRPQEARAEAQRMLVETRDAPGALLRSGQLHVALGDLPQARRDLERGLPEEVSSFGKEQNALTLAWILRQSGETQRAAALLEVARTRFEARRGGRTWRPEDYVESAQLRAVAGDREGALRAMQEAVRRGWRLYANGLLMANSLAGDPLLHSLRTDPRFAQLLAEVKADVDRQRARVEREGW